jgi:tRNA1(Val) A37 N6-methylase TrmN6
VIEFEEPTVDGFLNNRLSVCQPKRGFRAGHDSVLLAASILVAENGHVIELGSGVGVASLCLAARIGDCRVTGIEIDPELAALANENAKRNEMSGRVSFIAGDAVTMTFDRKIFDQVFLNPPFHPSSGRKSPDSGRARAMHDPNDALICWTARAIQLVGPGGSVTVVMRADRLARWRIGLPGALTVLPLLPRRDEEPKRVIARLNPHAPSSYRAAKPFVLHRPDGKPTDETEAVLRHGAPLSLE